MTKAEAWAIVKSLHVEEIECAFDGSGDSGDVHTVNFFSGEVHQGPFGAEKKSVAVPKDVEDVFVHWAYDVLEAEHGGWEIDDGAYGTITLDVATGEVSGEFYERVMSTNYSTIDGTFDLEDETDLKDGFTGQFAGAIEAANAGMDQFLATNGLNSPNAAAPPQPDDHRSELLKLFEGESHG